MVHIEEQLQLNQEIPEHNEPDMSQVRPPPNTIQETGSVKKGKSHSENSAVNI